ncbi:MAG: SLATT domain-containing protein [Actinomycetota bacterium]|nr:SLATT domain-containing protein [Actinomycetota bacterium]
MANTVEPGDGLPPATGALLDQWSKTALKSAGRHAVASDHFERGDSVLGLTSAALAAIVGSTVFVSLQQTTTLVVKLAAGALGLIAAVAAAVQTTAKYGGRAERHRQASRQYGALLRQVDEIRALPPAPDDLQSRIDQLRKGFDDAGAVAPDVPPRIWNRKDE